MTQLKSRVSKPINLPEAHFPQMNQTAGLKGGLSFQEIVKFQFQAHSRIAVQRYPLTLILLSTSVVFTGATLSHQRSWLFNQHLIQKQPIRLLSVLVLGTNILDMFKRAYGMWKYLGEWEQLYTRDLDEIDDIQDSKDYELPISREFVGSLALLATFSVIPHLLIPRKLGRKLHFYSLYPVVEHSIRWMWALTMDDSHSMDIGVVSLSPIYVPFILMVYDLELDFVALGWGFFCAVLGSWAMKTRRKDGKLVVDWLRIKYNQLRKLMK